ncbi:MAG: RNA helicase [Sanya eysarcoris guttigerus iflavirus 1]|nr:MAG: RNA helicase [Sanya eysarcoris guttigerus iflavirus 1]
MVNCLKMSSFADVLKRPYESWRVSEDTLEPVIRVCHPSSAWSHPPLPKSTPCPSRERIFKIREPNNARTRALREFEEAMRLGRVSNRTSRVSERFTLYLKKDWGRYYTARALLQRAKERRVYTEISHSIKWENTSIPKGVAQPTSSRQIKKKTPKESFCHDVLVEEHTFLPPPPMRSLELLKKLQVARLRKRCRQMPTTYPCRAPARLLERVRVHPRTHKVIRYARCHCNLCMMRSLLLKQTKVVGVGEGVGEWFKGKMTHTIDDSTKDFLDGALNKIKDSVKGAIDAQGKNIIDNLTAVGSILLTAAVGNSRSSWIVGLLSSFVVIGVLNTKTMAQISTDLSDPPKQPESSRPVTVAKGEAPSPMQQQEEYEQTDRIAQGLTLLFQTIGMYCGVTQDKLKHPPKNVSDWSILFSSNFQKSTRGHYGMLAFFRNFLDIVKSILKKIYFKLNPGAESIIAFWEHSLVCRRIIQEVDNVLTLPFSAFAKTDNMAMLESCIILTTEIIVRIGTVDTSTGTSNLLSYITGMKNKLLSLKRQCAQAGYSAVSRRTPYVIGLCGPRGLGKSHVINELANALSDVCNVSADVKGKTYNKRAGAKFYDGHTNEEIIVFDDFCQVQTPNADGNDALDIFEIVTDQPFRPNMAVAEEKGKIVDVKLVLMAMNDGFPKPVFITDSEALWRRRNQLIKVELADNVPVPTANSVFDPTYKHLKFAFYEDVKNPNKHPNTYVSFSEMIEKLKTDAAEYAIAEDTKVKHRIEQRREACAKRPRSEKPLSVEALELALKEALKVTSTDTIWNQTISAAYESKFMSWMRRRLSFLYETPTTDEAMEASSAALDNAVEGNNMSKIKIDKDNFQDFLSGHSIWSSITTAQQEEVKKLWEEVFPDYAFEPPRARTVAEGEGDNPNPEASTQTPKPEPVTILQGETSPNRPNVAPPNAMSPSDLDMIETYYFTRLDPDNIKIEPFCNTLPIKEGNYSPLAAWFVKYNDYCGSQLDTPVLVEAVKFIEDRKNTCKHTKCSFTVANRFDYLYVDKYQKVFTYYSCAKNEKDSSKCVLSNRNFVGFLKLFDPNTYKRMIEFRQTFKSYEALKLSEWQMPAVPQNRYKMITDWCKQAFKKYSPKLTTGLRWLWKFLKWVAMLLAPILVIVGLIFSFKGWNVAKEDPESSYIQTVKNLPPHLGNQWRDLCHTKGKSLISPYYGTTEGEATYTIVPRSPSGTVLSPQRIAHVESKAETDIIRIFRNATDFIFVNGRNRTTGAAVTMNLRIFKIGGQYILVPKHYISYLRALDPETLMCSMIINNNTYRINFKAFKMLEVVGSEMVVLNFESMPRSRDIRTHFATQQIWEAAPVPTHMRILEVHPDNTTSIYDINPRLVKNFGISCFNDVVATYGEVLSYKWAGEGRCMSIIFDDTLKIRGFHIAGDHKTNGYAAIVTRDLLMDLGPITEPAKCPFVDLENVPKVVLDGVVHTLGKVQAKYEVHLPTKTSIRPSEIHGVFPVRTVPPPLVPCSLNEYRDPLIEGIKKHGMPTLGFNSGDMRIIEERFTEMLLMNVKPKWNDVQVRSMDIAIRGVESTPGFKSLVLSTSEGFPFICERKGPGSKKWLIHAHMTESGTLEYSLHDRLIEEYEANMALRKKGIVPCTINVDCLKDARLPIEKAYIPGKVRIFSVAPTDFVIAFRQYFADFIVSFTAAKFQFFHALGIAPETSEWTDMVTHMTEVGNKFLTGDYSNFGPGFDNAVFKAVLRARIRWYEVYNGEGDALRFEEDQLVRKILNIETSEPIHLAKDLLYQTMSGMCSGSPSTTIDNCCVNIFYIMLAYYVIMSDVDPKLATLDSMYKHLRLMVFGDDVLMCVSDTICEDFNNLSLHKFFKQYGINYTDATKTGDIRKYCSLAEASFLKRTFVPHPYNRLQILGAVEKRSIEDCANWITKTIDVRSASVEATYAALQLAYGHGPEYFNHVRKILWDAWFKKGIRVTLRTWLDYDLMYNKRDFPIHVCAEAQGPPMSTPGETTNCDESKDTIIEDHAPPDTDCPKLSSVRIADWAGADYDASYERLVNRYILLDTIEWPTTKARDSWLKQSGSKKDEIPSAWTLPLDVLKKNVNTPTVLPFLQHKYAAFDMTVKVVVNANKFMIGQLLVAWYYLHGEDSGFKFRATVYSKTQMLSAVIDAGSSNSVELCIPYKNYRPYLHLLKDDHLGSNASFRSVSYKSIITIVCIFNFLQSRFCFYLC